MAWQTIEGTYENGAVRLTGVPPVTQSARVLVTFLEADGAIDLSTRGIDSSQAVELRAKLKTFGEDWNRPEMDGYDAL